MFPKLALATTLALLPAAADAQTGDCPPAVYEALFGLGHVEEGETIAPDRAFGAASEAIGQCGGDRIVLSLILDLLRSTGGQIDAPSDARDAIFLQAMRTAYEIAKNPAPFRPAEFTHDGAGVTWTVQDERLAFGGLVLALSRDYLDFGRSAYLYMADEQPRLGCGLYPDVEIEAYAGAPLLDERGELSDRVNHLGAFCDDADHRVSGAAALYWEAHALNAGLPDKPDAGYPVPSGEIGEALGRFLRQHLDGRAESDQFDSARATLWLGE